MLTKYIEKVLKDNISGSSSILNQLIIGFMEYLNDTENISCEDFKLEIDQLINQFASFAIVIHFLTSLQEWLNKNSKHCTNKKCKEFIYKYKSRWQTEENRLLINVTNTIHFENKKILLHSNSSLVQSILKKISKKEINITIYQTVSYPVNEGIVQAEKLTNLGFDVKLITDAAVNLIMPQIDFALIGTDAIFEEYFINKIGTYYIAQFAKIYEKEVYVVCDKRKILKEFKIEPKIIDRMLKENPKSPDEIYNSNSSKIAPVNYYFEKIPNNLITKFIH